MERERHLRPKNLLNYFVTTFNGMALGLFSTLIIGVIFKQVGGLIQWKAITSLGVMLQGLMGVGIGLGVTSSVNRKGLKLISGATAGAIGALMSGGSPLEGRPGDPMVAYITTVITVELAELILRKQTPLDILIIPLLSGLIAYGVALVIGHPISSMMQGIGHFLNRATHYQPFFMGMIIAVVVGMALTAPISSAAITIAIGLDGLAGGAAVIGCTVQMLGFAVMSRKDNNIGTVLSIAIGTSMLQFKNILRKPMIWLPTIIVSAILGPVSTMVFKMETMPYGAGMGTSGLVGQFGTFDAMGFTMETVLKVLVLHFVLPIILVWLVDVLFRKFKLIKKGDLAL